MRSISIVIVAFILAILFSATVPASGNVPPNSSQPEPQKTVCDEYLVTPTHIRIATWANTLRHGVGKTPDLHPAQTECIMDLARIAELDTQVEYACRLEPKRNFNDLAFQMLSAYLDPCGIEVRRN